MKVGVFDINDLVVVYAPPNLYSVMPGNAVMLRSGGPKMIVDYTIGDRVGDKHEAVCSWTVNGIRQTHVFDLRCLTCYTGVEE